MKIAVIGAGFAGLSLSYHLLTYARTEKIQLSVVLYDSKGIGKGASGVAAGLVHPYAGKKANLSHFGAEAFQASSRLLYEVDAYSQTNFHTPIILQKGILRPAALPEQRKFFFERSLALNEYPAYFLSETESKKFYPNPLNLPSLYIPDGLAVNSLQYLSSLFHLCQSLSPRFSYVQQHISDLSTLEQESFDGICIATGADIQKFFPTRIPINRVKGQKIDKAIPSSAGATQYSLSATAYAVSTAKERICIGSTYEHHFENDLPDLFTAARELEKKIALFWPELSSYPSVDVQAGMRATTASSMPIVIHKPPKIWGVTGLGSKGLLYHSWLGQLICKAFFNPDQRTKLLSMLGENSFMTFE